MNRSGFVVRSCGSAATQQHHLSGGIPAAVRQRDQDGVHTEPVGQRLGGTQQEEVRLARGLVPHFRICPMEAAAQTRAEGLEHGLLGREARGQRPHGLGPLALGEQAGAQAGLVRLAFAPDASRRVTLELQPTSVNNPFQSRELQEFQCPGQK